MITVILAFACAVVADIRSSPDHGSIVMRGYAALLAHALTTAVFDHTHQVLSESMGRSTALASATLGATVIGLPFYLFRTLVVRLSVRLPNPQCLTFLLFYLILVSQSTNS